MCAGGLPNLKEGHEIDVVSAALEMIEAMNNYNKTRKEKAQPILDLRVGIHTGPVVAGVVGHKKFAYDIWGSTVNIASRMESSVEVGRVNVSGTTFLKIKDSFHPTYRGKVKAKNVGVFDMYFVESAK